MSIPGGPSNPYSHTPGEPQPNPWGQSPPPSSYGFPQGHGGYGGYGGYGPTVPATGEPPPGPGGRRGAGGAPGWVWALGGAVVASSAWGGVLFATGMVSGSESADLAGYEFTEDLCAQADLNAFESDYELSGDQEPTSRSFQHEDVDQGHCEFTLEPVDASSDDYSTVYIYYDVAWHKGTDPAGEFAANASSYEQYNDVEDPYYEYSIEPVPDLGDEAFFILGENAEEEGLGWAMLSVRDGWFEYSLSWSSGLDSDEPGTEELSDPDAVKDLLVAATESTLDALQG